MYYCGTYLSQIVQNSLIILKKGKIMNIKGFTLAEVLITLVIIGVISAITVPTIITKYQKEQTVTKLKKAYSSLSQTTARAISDYGPIKTWEIGLEGDTEKTRFFLNKYLIPYLSVQKPPTTKEEGKWNSKFMYLNKEKHEYSITSRTNTSSNGKSQIYLYIDINGDKKPNKFGKDIFLFTYSLTQERVYPIGLSSSRDSILSNSNYQCHKNQIGETCAALIMKDGWKIADDYPW